MKVLTQTGLTELITKIKAWGNAVFLKRAEVEQATTIDIDTVPTTDSSNLITSGGVKTALDGKGTYTKPDSGIPKTDLASDVQTSLGKADTALQTHQSLAAYRTASAQDVIDNTKETTANKTAILSSESTDTQYPTAKVVYDNVSAKSTVSASTTGTTATEAKFITIDGVEWKLADSGSATDTNAVHYLAETKTEEQKGIARTNIGAENVANKVTTITSASTDIEYPSAKAVFDTEQDIKEIAEGKTKTYVVSKATNPSFDTQAATVQLTGTFTDINSVVHDVSELKLGDNIYVQELDVPDRWCSDPQAITPEVPEGYTQITHLEGRGEGNIDLGMTWNEGYVETQIYPLAAGLGTSYQGILGQNGSIQLGWITGQGWNHGQGTVAVPYVPVAYTNYILKWEKSSLKYYVDGQETGLTRTGPMTLKIFYCEASNKYAGFRWLKLYNDNGDLVHRFLPCYRNSDDATGVYDVIGNQFYPATGTLIRGAGAGVTLYKLETAKVPVTDVQKNGVSVVTNTVANITVPTKTSDIVNDSGFLTQHQDISGKEDKTNKVTSMSASSTDTQYPSAKAVYDAIQAIPAGYESVTIDTSITTMAQLAAKVDEINTAGRHAFFDMHNQITGAYVCLVQKYTESTVDYMFIFDLLNRHVYGSLVGYSGTTLISDYIAASGNNNDLPYVLKITDINTTLATMITLIDQVNALGQHVLIDVSALNTKDYLITFSYKTGASVTACKAIGLVNGTEAYKGYTTAELSTTLLSTFLNTAGDLSSYFVGTYAELKLLKDNSLLIPGAKYRLTDYELTTNYMLTNCVNGNHPFDLILTADTSTSFNERCAAARHVGDTYYANCDLSQWVVDYQFENNNAIHRWCDTSANGKGCIYGLKDERNNFCSWDFKNLAFWAGHIKSNYVNSSKNNSRSYNTVLYTMGGETDLSVQYGKSSLSNFNMCNLHFYDPDAAWPFVILLDTTNARSVNLRSTGNVWSPNSWPHYTLNCTGSIEDVDIKFDSTFEFYASTFIHVTGTAERIYNSVLAMSWVNLDQVNLSNSNCNIQYSQISGSTDIRFTAASPNMKAANEAPTVIFANKRIKGYIGEPLYCVSNSTDVGFDISGQTFVELTTTASERFTAEWRDSSGLLNTVYCNSSSIPLTYSTIPTFPIKISTSLAWDKEIRAGSTTPAITLPSPKTSASYAETMSYIFTAATTTASFTAPANYVMTDTTFTGMSTTGNTITLSNLETGHLYIVKFKVVSSNQIIMETEDWGALSV